jgi:hypothetical protein
MATLTRVAMATGIASDPMAILTWIPVAAVFVSIGLLVLICRRLQLPAWPTAIAALCMALVPTTQLAHGPGEIDHHFAEMIFLLAALAGGLSWLQDSVSWRRAAFLGVVLGVAPAIHNGLFILQLPLLVATFAWWLQQRQMPMKSTLAFGGALPLATLAMLIPSLPFRLGHFEFYTFSWFHLYVAACTSAVMLMMSRLRFTRAGLAILMAAAAVLAIPFVRQLDVAGTFLAGTHPYFATINEMRSPAELAMKKGFLVVARIYSLLIYIAPATLVLCLVQGWRERASPRLLFWITSVLGLGLLSAQQRLHYFGGFALYLPWLILASEWANRRPELRRNIFLGASAAAVLFYFPVLRYQLIEPMAPANDAYFQGVRPLYGVLSEACARQPGMVLADSDAGHHIRFYTDCSVIANNFLLTPQHFAKIDEADHLFSLSAAQLAAQQPHIEYVLIRALAMRELDDGSVQYQLYYSHTSQLAAELLYSDPAHLPPNYTLLQEMSFKGKAPYARLFRIEHPGQPRG